MPIAARISARVAKLPSMLTNRESPPPWRSMMAGMLITRAQGKLGINLGYRVAQRGGEAIGIGTSAHHEREGRQWPLKKGFVDFRVVAGFLRIKFHVGDNADDLAPFGGGAGHIQANLFPERFLVL